MGRGCWVHLKVLSANVAANLGEVQALQLRILKIKAGDLPSLSPVGQAKNGEATSLVGRGQPWGKA